MCIIYPNFTCIMLRRGHRQVQCVVRREKSPLLLVILKSLGVSTVCWLSQSCVSFHKPSQSATPLFALGPNDLICCFHPSNKNVCLYKKNKKGDKIQVFMIVSIDKFTRSPLLI